MTGVQKKYQRFFMAFLESKKIENINGLSEENMDSLFSDIDKAWQSQFEENITRAEVLSLMQETVKLRRNLMNRDFPNLSEDDNDPGNREQGADTDSVNNGNSELTIEFPDGIRLDFECKPEDVENIKGKAQTLYNEGMPIVEIAKSIAMEFEGCTWEIESVDKEGERKIIKKQEDGKEEKEKEEDKMKESFSSFLSGRFKDPVQEVKQGRHDKTITEMVVRKLERITAQIQTLEEDINSTSPIARKKLKKLVGENLESLGNLLLED